jgi:uncharacterized protein (TIGR02466 family)
MLNLLHQEQLKNKMKQSIDHALFPTLILECPDILSLKENNEIYKFIVKNKNLGKAHKILAGDNVTSSHTGNTNFLIDNDIFKNLNNKILTKTLEYSNKTGTVINNTIANSWFNIQGKNSVLLPHTHANSKLSGVIYIKTDEKSNPLYFHNPNPYIINYHIKSDTKYSFEWFRFYPKIGTLLLFPSWLTHSSNSERNLSKERVLVSFNII